MTVIEISALRSLYNANRRAIKQNTDTTPVRYPVCADDWETLEIEVEVDLQQLPETQANISPPKPAREPDQMPWTSNDTERHTHKATTSALQQLWAKVANETLERTGDEGRAIREANAVVAKGKEAGH